VNRSALHYRVGLVLIALSLAFAALVTFIIGGGGDGRSDEGGKRSIVDGWGAGKIVQRSVQMRAGVGAHGEGRYVGSLFEP
jgi:hypothetical protein